MYLNPAAKDEKLAERAMQLLLVPELRKVSAVRRLLSLHASLLSRRRSVEGAILSDTASVVNSFVAFGTIARNPCWKAASAAAIVGGRAENTWRAAPAAPSPTRPFARTGNGAEARPSASSEVSQCPPFRPSRSTTCARSSSAVTAARRVRGRRRRVAALKGLSFTMQKGECVAILGQNGSGKSTLVRLLSTLLLARRRLRARVRHRRGRKSRGPSSGWSTASRWRRRSSSACRRSRT